MKSTKKIYTNHLISENSPYLLQHANNPVDWYPWGEEALEKARKEDKLILVSVGYSACHWCHVMAHESFENEEIAEIMNENFVCIKVDREERPDVDNMYMSAVQLITGRGGWPLNCFALPDGKPVYGGTYFRPGDWKKILLNLSESYQLDKPRFLEIAGNIEKGIKDSEFAIEDTEESRFDFKELATAVNRLKSNFDEQNGGMSVAPKFPMPVFWNFLNEYAFYSGDKTVKKQTEQTFTKIANGGINDLLAGGFARYSIDAKWIVPHFEKMLYDNAQLVSLYSKAYHYMGNNLYKKTVFQTLEFIKNEMTSKEGAFYSSYDADSEGEEGKYYVWSQKEIETLLKDDAPFFCEYFNISSSGNWEYDKNILYISDSQKETLKKYNLSDSGAEEKIKRLKSILLKERSKRIKPGKDDKILTAWNALMISGYADAYKIFDKPEYLNSAEKAAKFITEKMTDENNLLKRSYKDGNIKIDAFSDDYALLTEAFIKLFQLTGKEYYLLKTRDFTEYMLEHFYDKNSGMFFHTSDLKAELAVRQKEISDNVIPASNSVTAKNLYTLGMFFLDTNYSEIAEKMTAKLRENTLSNLNYFAGWASLYLKFSKPSYELVITGKDAEKLNKQFNQTFRPDVLTAYAEKSSEMPIFKDRFKEGETLIYVCENNVCNRPVKTFEEAQKLLARKC